MAWVMVPTGSIPRSSAPLTVDTPSHPPTNAARSTIAAIPGCTRRAPKA